jgi:uncharacterized membrane protein YhhN
MKKSSFALYYFSLGIIFIILQKYFQLYYLETAVKALIIPSLMLYFHLSLKKKYSLFHRLVMAGLLFSWLGNIFLQLENGTIRTSIPPESYFLIGMLAFLATFLFYIVAFNIPSGKNLILSKRIYQPLLVFIYGGLILWLLYNNLEIYGIDYRIPVILVSVFILLMLISAMNRYGKVNGVSYMLVVSGALFFVASSSMVVINKFLESFDFARILIMLSYIIAQYLIVMGSIAQDHSEKE